MARNWAITIGINGYRYLRQLNYAMRDADAVRQFFEQDLGFHKVYHFTDASPPIAQDYGPDLDSQPTSTTLNRFLRTRFDKSFLRDGDNLWFFFAGHGIRYGNRDYLMPMDGDRDDLERSAIPIHYISERLRCSGADNVILLIDACRSYEGRRDGIGIGQERQQGVITLFSCSPEESSYEIQELEQGAFTHVLLDSLRLQGEGNCATVERLYQRLRYGVPQITRQYKRVTQTPYGVIEPPSKNHLILLPRQATLADIETLKKQALTAEVQQNKKAAKQFWVRVLAVSPADPEAIEGIERLSWGGNSSSQVISETPARSLDIDQSNPLVTPRAVIPTPAPKPVPPATAPKKPTVTPPVPTPKPSSEPSDPSPKSEKPKRSDSVRTKAPVSKPPQHLVSPRSVSKSSKSPYTLGDSISRRKAIQILGFTGGGIGAVLLGRALLPSGSSSTTITSPTPSDSDSSGPIDTAEPFLREEDPGPSLTVQDFEPVSFEVVTVNDTGVVANQETKQSQVFTESLGDARLKMVTIPGGTFTMGSPPEEVGRQDDEGPQHEVTVAPFLLGQYQVTQLLWRAVSEISKVERDLDPDPSRFKGDNRPVESVSWDDAVEFCKRLSKQTGRLYRLPSEAEWEYACRAGTTTPFHFGETLTTELANYNGNGTYKVGPKGEYRQQTVTVGSFSANAFGLYDIHGNVWEWCLDHWHQNFDGAPTDGSAWIEGGYESLNVLRGGSWDFNPDYCRSADRNRDARDLRYYNVGFRVVCAVPWTLE